MTSHQSRRDEVEAILGPDATAAEAAALTALFAAAAGPALTGELKGEAAALAAFRAAQPVAVPTRTAKFRAAVFTVKAAVAALAVTSVGGVALAATTEVLPKPLTIKHSTDRTPTKPAEKPADKAAADPAAVRDAAKTAAAADRADAKAGRDNSASFDGRCTAFTAGGWDNARAAGNPAFSRLVAAAPQGDVAAFCAALAAEAPKTPAADKVNSPGGKDAADQGKSADAREKAATKDKAAKTKAAKAKADKVPNKNAKSETAQRDQPSR